jgi:hypothetical protein
MARLTGALVAVLCLCSSVGATTTLNDKLPRIRPSVEAVRPSSPPAAVAPAPAGVAGEFSLTADSEVRVNGRRCEYKDVPAGATIVRIEVAPDRKTVVRIEFRTTK